MKSLTGGGLSLAWSETGSIILSVRGQRLEAGGEPMFFLNGAPAEFSRIEQQDSGGVILEARNGAGELRVTWRGRETRMEAWVEADCPEGEVTETGFALPLPAAFLVSGNGSTVAWDQATLGQRISLDGAAFTMTQLFLLDFGAGWLRVGRQEKQRRDYTTGYLEKRENGWFLVWLWQPQKPFPEKFASQALEFAVFDSRAAAIDEHRAWMEKVFGLVPKEESPLAPGWLHHCQLLCQINLGESNGAILHDYFDVRNLIYALRDARVPKDTILYLLDYNPLSWVLQNRESGVYVWPENPLLGGEAAFRALMAAAHECGYRVLCHSTIVLYGDRTGLGAPGLDGRPLPVWHNPEWSAMKPHVVLDTHGDPVGFPSAELPPLVGSGTIYGLKYLDNRFPAVQDHFLQAITRVRSEYGVDAFHLDSLSNVDQRDSCFNTPFEAGERAAAERELMRKMHERNPGTLFWAERLTEETADLTPMTMFHYPAEFARFYSELFGKYHYTVTHTAMPGWIPQRYPQGCMISAFSEDAMEQELEAIRTMPNCIPRVKLNYRDCRLDDRSIEHIHAVLEARKQAGIACH